MSISEQTPAAAARVTPFLYILHYEGEGVAVEVWLNGLPVFREPSGRQLYVESKVNQFILPGRNEVSILARPLMDTTPEKPLHFRTGNRATRVFLAAGHQGSMVGEAEAIVRFPGDDPKDTTALARKGLFRIFRASFDAPRDFGPWAWQSAPGDPPTNEELRAAGVELWHLHAAFARRDAEDVLARTSFRTQEVARAMGLDPADWTQGNRGGLIQMFSQPNWNVVPLDWDGLVAHTYADGRMLQWTDRAGRPPIRARYGDNNDKVFVSSPIFARIEGAWRIVR